jgi:hypothetical protein
MPRPYTIDRKTFLRGAGVSMALPLLNVMRPSASAAPPAKARRLVCVGVDLSLNPATFFPTSSGRDYALSPLLKPLADVRDQFTVFSHLDHPGVSGGHRSVHAYLSGVTSANAGAMPDGNITVDQRAAEFVGAATRFPSLQTSVGSKSGRMSWSRSGMPISTIADPASIYRALFVNDSGGDKIKRAATLDLDRSILDAVNDQAKALDRRLGKADHEKLDEYLTAVRELEKRLQMNQQWVHRPKPQVAQKAPRENGKWSNFAAAVPLMYDLILLALETDSTRVATLQIPSGGSPVGGLNGVNMGYHNLSHHGQDAERQRQLQIIETFLTSQLARFLTKLQAKKEHGRSMLDDTMVLFGSGMGNGNSHSNRELPVLLAGGGFRHGQHIDFAEGRGPGTLPLCNLLLTMLQRFGLETDTFNTSSGTIDVG